MIVSFFLYLAQFSSITQYLVLSSYNFFIPGYSSQVLYWHCIIYDYTNLAVIEVQSRFFTTFNNLRIFPTINSNSINKFVKSTSIFIRYFFRLEKSASLQWPRSNTEGCANPGWNCSQWSNPLYNNNNRNGLIIISIHLWRNLYLQTWHLWQTTTKFY